MTTVILLLALAGLLAALVRYVRNDGFASSRTPARDELGAALRPQLR